MRHSDFILKVQGYYGQGYRVGQKDTLRDYLKKIPESELEILYDYTTAMLSSKYKALPDKADFEAARKQIEADRKEARELESPAYQLFQIEGPTEETLSKEESAARLRALLEKLEPGKREGVERIVKGVIA